MCVVSCVPSGGVVLSMDTFDNLPKSVRDALIDSVTLEKFMSLRTHYTCAVLSKTLGDVDTFGTDVTKSGIKWISDTASCIDDMTVLDSQMAGSTWANTWLHMVDVGSQCASVAEKKGKDKEALNLWKSNFVKVTDDIRTSSKKDGGGDNRIVINESTDPTPTPSTSGGGGRNFVSALQDWSSDDTPPAATAEQAADKADKKDGDPVELDDGFMYLYQAMNQYFHDSHKSTGWPQLCPECETYAANDTQPADPSSAQTDGDFKHLNHLKHPFEYQRDGNLGPMQYQIVAARLECAIIENAFQELRLSNHSSLVCFHASSFSPPVQSVPNTCVVVALNPHCSSCVMPVFFHCRFGSFV